MERQKPIFLFYPGPISGPILAFHSIRVRGHIGMGLFLTRMSHAHFATRWDGANLSLLRVRGKLSVLPYAPTPQQWDLATAEGYSYSYIAGLLINFTAPEKY